MVHKLENEKERDIIIDHRYYRNIIGSKGDNIREIREMFNQVQITFPGPGKLFLETVHNYVVFLLLCASEFRRSGSVISYM
jgi:hypothetical protein